MLDYPQNVDAIRSLLFTMLVDPKGSPVEALMQRNTKLAAATPSPRNKSSRKAVRANRPGKLRSAEVTSRLHAGKATVLSIAAV